MNVCSTEIPKMIFYTRILNLILGICMIVVSLLSLLTTDNMTTGVLACYVVVFACLLCCFESGLQVVLRVIALNFGFMYSAKARSVFMVFIGTILFSFSLFGKIIGIAMLANAGLNVYAIVKYPGYEEAQRDRSTSEIKDYLKENPAFAKTFVDAGASIIASNPGAAVAVATSAAAYASPVPQQQNNNNSQKQADQFANQF
jgi:hypothetical protein